MGKAMLTIMTAFAQLERDTLIEPTRAGLAAAAANGRKGGRPRAKSPTKPAPRERHRGHPLLPGTENDDDAVTLDEDEDDGVDRYLDGVIAAVTASSAR